eukprot:4194425-Alexandrium_andersonii.AAC.1
MLGEPIAAGAGQPRQRILPTGVREVSGDDEKALLAEIADGQISKPELLEFNDWIRRRKGPGKMPAKALGDQEATMPGEESSLWRGVMTALYGQEWRSDLMEMREARQLEVAEDQELQDEHGPHEERSLAVARAP